MREAGPPDRETTIAMIAACCRWRGSPADPSFARDGIAVIGGSSPDGAEPFVVPTVYMLLDDSHGTEAEPACRGVGGVQPTTTASRIIKPRMIARL